MICARPVSPGLRRSTPRSWRSAINFVCDFKAGRGKFALQNLNKSLDNQFIDQAVIYYYRGLTQLNLLKNNTAAKLDFQSYLATGDNRYQQVVQQKLTQI